MNENLKDILNACEEHLKYFEKEKPESKVAYTLANLMHYCQQNNINFPIVLQKAKEHFEIEKRQYESEK